MATYTPPIRDMQFVLHELLGAESKFAELGYEDASADLVDAVLEEGGRICAEAVFPTNRPGDEEGCSFHDGEVTTPDGYKEAYRVLAEGGWIGLGCDPEYGGQGLPYTVSVLFEEMLQSANVSLALYPGLTHGAYIAMKAFASDELKQRYLPKMLSGEWAGTMCLTESHCGTDLGLLRTRAQPHDDGTYRITGTKIFITGGEQDLTENIVHLVLARLPDAPPGVKGISMFLVPKHIPDEDGSLGERNAVHCGSIEHKMGIKGASTCVMNYEGAVGWLVGEEHRGLRAMFSMMNFERLMVGQQGLSLGEVAYQSAANYARERAQGRSLSGAAAPDAPADPIIVHPDVRRMLLTARSHNEAARVLIAWVSLLIDTSMKHPDAAERERADDLVALLIPVVKAYFTDYGSQVCNECMQVLGGHGYIAEWGMEQLVRDVRIAQIYEGANGIHALDLVRRKLPMHGGRLVRRYLQCLDEFLGEARDEEAVAEFVGPLAEARDRLAEATDWVAKASASNPEEAGAASYDYLRLMALTSFAHMWAWSARVAAPKVEGDNTGFYGAKLATARYFYRRHLPQTRSLAQTLSAGAECLMDLEAEAF